MAGGIAWWFSIIKCYFYYKNPWEKIVVYCNDEFCNGSSNNNNINNNKNPQYFLVDILFSVVPLVSSQSRNFCLFPFYFLILLLSEKCWKVK